jgi:transmembrane sensor
MPIDPEYIEQLALEEISGLISPEDSATLKRLVEEDPEAYKIWSDVTAQLSGDYIRSVRQRLPTSMPTSGLLSRIRNRKRRNITIGVIGIAASLLLTVVLYRSLHVDPIQPATIRLFSIKVPDGKQYIKKLPDGTQIRLNAGTTLQYSQDFNREVTINGEAYLNVAADPRRPFRVYLPHSNVEVLGTEFNVNTYDSGQVKIALIKGAIHFHTPSGSLKLKQGEQVNYEVGKKLVAIAFNTSELLAWQEGIYTFRNTKLYDICKVLERLYAVTVIIDSEQAGNLHFTTKVSRQTPLRNVMEELKGIDNGFDYAFEKGDSILHMKYVNILH